MFLPNSFLLPYYTLLCICKLDELDKDVLEMMQGPKIHPLGLAKRPTLGCLFLGDTLVEHKFQGYDLRFVYNKGYRKLKDQ